MLCLCKILVFYASYTILPFGDYNKGGGGWYVSVLGVLLCKSNNNL